MGWEYKALVSQFVDFTHFKQNIVPNQSKVDSVSCICLEHHELKWLQNPMSYRYCVISIVRVIVKAVTVQEENISRENILTAV